MAKLTPEQRKKLPLSAFAIPGKAPGPGSFPINDRAHAIAAQRMACAPGQKCAVDKKIASKFPDMLKKKGNGKSPFLSNKQRR